MFGQKEKNINIRLPFGLRDIFPLESSERNTIKRIIGDEFRSWGYGEVKTPIMEYTENISVGVGSGWKDKLINFLDIDGNLLSLRSDMTIPIARLAGMRLKKDQLPARFCYFSDVFRQTGSQVGNKRVFTQAGLEFLGSSRTIEADAEVMVILIRVLKSLGLEDFRMVLGHMGFINGLLDWFKLDEEMKPVFKKYIVDKDFVRVESLLKGYDSGKTGIFMGLIQPGNDIGKISGIVSDIDEKKVTDIYRYLKDLYQMLEDQELEKYLIFDFSTIRDFDYYTGLLFEVYYRGITGMIGSGGRYDDLIKKFGNDIPATGFALDIDIIHGALGDKDLSGDIKIMLLCPDSCGSRRSIMEFAGMIRGKGINVEMLFDSVRESTILAREKNCSFLLEPLKDLAEFRITDIEGGRSRMLDKSALLDEVEKWKKK